MHLLQGSSGRGTPVASGVRLAEKHDDHHERLNQLNHSGDGSARNQATNHVNDDPHHDRSRHNRAKHCGRTSNGADDWNPAGRRLSCESWKPRSNNVARCFRSTLCKVQYGSQGHLTWTEAGLWFHGSVEFGGAVRPVRCASQTPATITAHPTRRDGCTGSPKNIHPAVSPIAGMR